MLARSEVGAKKRLGGFRCAALGVSLACSALLTALALQFPHFGWFAWFSFLPIIVSIRVLRPETAAFAGGSWGACLYLAFSAFGSTRFDGMDRSVGSGLYVLHPSAGSLALLIAISAVYVGLSARPARAIVFRLLTLALGWTLVQAVLQNHLASGVDQGLLGSSEGEDRYVQLFARLLGYVCMTLLVACVNASLVGLFSVGRLGLRACRTMERPTVVGVWWRAQVVLPLQACDLRKAHPRAPPILPNCNAS